MLLGRQVVTDFGKYIDVLALDPSGVIYVIDLIRNRTPREAVAQLLDYASWVKNLSYNDMIEIYSVKNQGREFEEAYDEAFGASPPEKLNEDQQLIIVASELDPATERIIDYLSDGFGVPINAVFFQYFQENGSEYLTRTWLLDPKDVEAKSIKSKSKKDQEPWNGRDFYFSFGEGNVESGHFRSWNDARKYGFVSAGGGKWYT